MKKIYTYLIVILFFKQFLIFAYDVELFVSKTKMNPSVTPFYPQIHMGDNTTHGGNDWTYNNDTCDLFVCPQGSVGIYGASFEVDWDNTKANFLSVIKDYPDNLFGSNVFIQYKDSSSGANGRMIFNIISSNLQNVVPINGKMLIGMKFKIIKPGYNHIEISTTPSYTAPYFIQYNGVSYSTLSVHVNTGGGIRFYLGDFYDGVHSLDTVGDASVDNFDLADFTSSYWAHSTDPNYLRKCDIGPTQDASINTMPVPDSVIGFEDLVIFAISYGQNGYSPIHQIHNKNSLGLVTFYSSTEIINPTTMKLHVNLITNPGDIRAFSFSISYTTNTLQYAGVEKQGEMSTSTSFLSGKASNGTVYVDGAVLGGSSGLNNQGLIFNVIFTSSGTSDAIISSAAARNSLNQPFTNISLQNEFSLDSIFVCTDNLNPVTTPNFYPNHNMCTHLTADASDWYYTGLSSGSDTADLATFYLVPMGNNSIHAASLKIHWDNTKANLYSVSSGHFFPSELFIWQNQSRGSIGDLQIDVGNTSSSFNTTPYTGGNFAVVRLKILKPGFHGITISDTTQMLNHYIVPNDQYVDITGSKHDGRIEYYLGDIASSNNNNSGDSHIDFYDATQFSISYFSHVGDPTYKYKYDMGPTQGGGYFSGMPLRDGVINIYDLNIFATGFSYEANGGLQHRVIDLINPIVFSSQKMKVEQDGTIKLPIKISGNFTDLMTFSMVFNSANLELVKAEKDGEFAQANTLLFSKSEKCIITVDGGILGNKNHITKDGIIVNIIFKVIDKGQPYSCTFDSVQAWNFNIDPYIVQFNNANIPEIVLPKEFVLNQNYPNPFNPSTIIKYQLPTASKINISIYDINGRRVENLVEEVQKAGYYSIEWNAANYASGVYFCKMVASGESGNYKSVKKMLLVK